MAHPCRAPLEIVALVFLSPLATPARADSTDLGIGPYQTRAVWPGSHQEEHAIPNIVVPATPCPIDGQLGKRAKRSGAGIGAENHEMTIVATMAFYDLALLKAKIRGAERRLPAVGQRQGGVGAL
jgi:hypothetical protein